MSTAALEAAAARLHDGGKILVTRLRYIGDVVLTLPLVQVLRRAFPAAALHYLAEPSPLAVLGAHPHVDRLWCAERSFAGTWRTAAALRRERFDVVIDLFANPRSALLSWWSGAPVRIGEARRSRRHLYTVARVLAAGRTALEHHLEAAALLGVAPLVPERPQLFLTEDERAPAAAALAAAARGRPTVLVHWGATQRAKEWPETHTHALVQRLIAAGVHVVVSSAPHRTHLSTALAAAIPAVQCLPVLPLRQLLAWIAAADAVVGVDGGIVHCSVAVGRPTLALFGPTSPHVWFPYAGFGPFRVLHAGVDCGHCDRNLCPTRACMTALDVDRVEQQLWELLAAVPRHGRSCRGMEGR